MKRLYFPNLNGIRCIAAFMVVFYHVEQFKSLYRIKNWHVSNEYGVSLGGLGVTLFFVLSGFLITYILIEEKRSGPINIRNFYFRRALRIWPLYYFIIVLAFAVLNRIDFFRWPEVFYADYRQNLILDLLFLPNLVVGNYNLIPFASMVWSIGVEEQFYLFWPWLIKFVRRPLVLFTATVCVPIGLFSLYLYLRENGILSDVFGFDLFQFFVFTRFECMAVGAMAAYLAIYKRDTQFVRFLFARSTQWVCLAITVLLVVNNVTLEQFSHLCYALFFAVLILNLACNDRTIISLENAVFDYLGKISYGIYMYHVIAVYTVFKTALHFKLHTQPVLFNLALYSLSALLVILLSSLSYYLLERPFLKLKLRYSQFVSGDFARKPSDAKTA